MIDKTKFHIPRTSPRIVLVGAGALLVAGFMLHGYLKPSTADQKAADLPPVTVATAQLRDVPVYAQAVGTVMANATVQVKSRVDGQIVEAGFKEGQLVRKGDLLFQIDSAPYEAALRAAEANLQRDEAQLANARLDLGRATKLVKSGYGSQQTRDAANAQAKALTGTVAADRAAIDQAKLQLGYTEIRSPIDGKTGPFLVDVGNIVTAAAGTPLVIITQIQPVKISFALAQQNLPKLQQRLADKALVASLKTRDDKADDVTAPIDFIGNTVNAQSGTIELRATYENADMRLVPGEFVDVRVRIDDLKQAVTVPRDAVNTGQAGPYVYAITADDKVELRKVTVLHQNEEIAAVEGAIKDGENVIVDGQLRVAPGMAVKIVTRGPATS
ncbi:efflux RND transporter periplasmic adaptor subunit [Parvibaculum sp.]|uniref:efflux RND transporter periplasmic adaptor subunit n=1 Tax=Parvibaculum sp. TaxID=2024848 RepID=UPI002C40B5AC|nr:efflux RND transporter periplasmic adaptor subunit [Parvibaculum sp.]HUD50547.1 efflux RND transporter periplasmic adaptor subunit [Parvibaculum sp.]